MGSFKDFLLRGNVIDMAVGIVIGIAFNAVVQALVADFITPLLAAIGGQPDFAGLSFTLNGSTFLYGHFVNACVSFLIIAAVLFFCIIRPMERFFPKALTTKPCTSCLEPIALLALKCKFCCTPVEPPSATTMGDAKKEEGKEDSLLSRISRALPDKAQFGWNRTPVAAGEKTPSGSPPTSQPGGFEKDTGLRSGKVVEEEQEV